MTDIKIRLCALSLNIPNSPTYLVKYYTDKFTQRAAEISTPLYRNGIYRLVVPFITLYLNIFNHKLHACKAHFHGNLSSLQQLSVIVYKERSQPFPILNLYTVEGFGVRKVSDTFAQQCIHKRCNRPSAFDRTIQNFHIFYGCGDRASGGRGLISTLRW